MTALIEYFLPVGRPLDGEVLRRYRLMVAFLLVTASYAILYVPVSVFIGYRSALIAIPSAALACLILSFALRRGTSIVIVCNSYLLVLSVLISFLWLSTGGLTETPNDPGFSALFPVIALLLIGRKWAVFWLGVTLALVALNGIPELLNVVLPVGMSEGWVPWF